MERYVRYKNEVVKIGDDEDLYCTSFRKYHLALKKGFLSQLAGHLSPEEYAKHSGPYRFRFPFPDEDKFAFGDIGNFPRLRGLRLKIDPGTDTRLIEQLKLLCGQNGLLEITQQKIIFQSANRKFSLVTIIRNPESGNSFRIEDESFIFKLNKNIILNHVVNEPDMGKKNFYRTLIARILRGYHQNIPSILASYGEKRSGKKRLRS